jgi:hypothetical protein
MDDHIKNELRLYNKSEEPNKITIDYEVDDKLDSSQE